MNVKIMVRGPEDRRVEHIADIQDEDDLPNAVGVAMGMYRTFYPDAPPYRQTVEIDPTTWKAPEFGVASESSTE